MREKLKANTATSQTLTLGEYADGAMTRGFWLSNANNEKKNGLSIDAESSRTS
jgi:hypothetical protein